MLQRITLGPSARFLSAFVLVVALLAVLAGAVFGAPLGLTTEPVDPDGSNGWFRTLPTVTIGPPLPGSNILYQWRPSGPISIYSAPFKLDSSTYGQPTLRFGYGVTDSAFDLYVERTFKIDPVKPVIDAITESTGLSASTWTNSTDATFVVGATDLHSLVGGYSYVMQDSQPAVDETVDSSSASIGLHGLFTAKWYFQVKAVDNAGNWSDVAVRQHWVDITPPVASTVVQPEYEGTATVNVSAIDPHSGVSVIESKIDTEEYTDASARSVTSPGPHVIGYRASDNAGNVSAESTAAFVVVPNQPPTTTISGVDELWHDTGKFTLSATDNSSGVDRTYYRIDGGVPTQYISEVSITQSGVHVVEYWSVDRVGNVETTKTASIKVDNEAPSVVVNAPAVAEGTATVTFAAADSKSGLVGPPVVLLDGAAWLGGSPLQVSAPGVHTIFVMATDSAGNSANTSVTFTVLANSAPVTSISGLAGSWATAETFELSAVDNESGVAYINYTLNGGATEEYFSPVSISEEGTTAIRYWSVDALGTVEPVKGPAYAYVDRSAPVTIAKPWAPRIGTISVILASSDAYSGVQSTWYKLDGGAVTTYTAAVSTSVKGLHTLEYGAVDNVGNTEVSKKLVFSVPRVPATLSARLSASQVLSGRATVVSGALKTPNGPIRGSGNVYLWSSVMGGAWTRVGRATYDPGTGTYRIARTVTANQRLQLRFAGDTNNLPANSAILAVGCRVYISAPVTPWFNSVGRNIVVYGTLSPKHTVGSTVATLYCYRLESGRWVMRKSVAAKAYYASTGVKYGTAVSLPLRGTWRIVAVHSDSRHSRTVSPARTLLVR